MWGFFFPFLWHIVSFFFSLAFLFFPSCEGVHSSGQVDRRLHYGAEAGGEEQREKEERAFDKSASRSAPLAPTNASRRREEH